MEDLLLDATVQICGKGVSCSLRVGELVGKTLTIFFRF